MFSRETNEKLKFHVIINIYNRYNVVFFIEGTSREKAKLLHKKSKKNYIVTTIKQFFLSMHLFNLHSASTLLLSELGNFKCFWITIVLIEVIHCASGCCKLVPAQERMPVWEENL